MKNKYLLISLFSLLTTACNLTHKATIALSTAAPAYQEYKIDNSYKQDTGIVSFLRPYALNVAKQMDVVIGEAGTPLERKTPEGTLGNFAADAMLQMARTSFKQNVDAAICNFDGLRIDHIAAGPVTLGKMYELMPFDNILVLVKLKGSQLHELLDVIAAKHGWPVAGIRMQIKEDKAVNITLNDQPLNAAALYTIALSDYVANGNDGAGMLKNVKQLSNGYLFRDALIDYVRDLTKQGKKMNASIEKRISNV